ncbi:MAG: type II toxin-antitoxin system HicA family toxin [Patescibacteria group bacterium]
MPKIIPINYQKLVKIFQIEGFAVNRIKGDHLIMVKMSNKRPLVIKMRPTKVPVTHIKTNLHTAGISRKRYFELLEKV